MKVLIGVDEKGIIISATSLGCTNEAIGDDLHYLASQKDLTIHVVDGQVTIGSVFKDEAIAARDKWWVEQIERKDVSFKGICYGQPVLIVGWEEWQSLKKSILEVKE